MLYADEILQTMEPNKCEGWHWRSWDEIRQWAKHHDDTASEWADKKCFLPIRSLIQDYGDLVLPVQVGR